MNCDSSTGVLFARINMKVETRRDALGLVGLLKSLASNLPEKAPSKGRPGA